MTRVCFHDQTSVMELKEVKREGDVFSRNLVDNVDTLVGNNVDTLVDNEDGGEGRKKVGKMRGCNGCQVGETDVQRSELLEGRLCLN